MQHQHCKRAEVVHNHSSSPHTHKADIIERCVDALHLLTGASHERVGMARGMRATCKRLPSGAKSRNPAM